jgi:hypothetical protein
MPNPALGSNTSILIGDESAFKTPDFSAAEKLPVENPSMKKERNKSTPKSLTGKRQPRKVVRGKGKTSGSFDLECNPTSVLKPYQKWLGSREDFGTSDLRASRFTLGPLASFFTVHQHPDTGIWTVGKGNVGSQIAWTMAEEGVMLAKCAYMGAKRDDVAVAPVADGAITDRTLLDPLDYLLIRVMKNGVKLGEAKSEEISLNNSVSFFPAQDETDEQFGFSTDPPTLGGKVTLYLDDIALLGDGTDAELDLWVPGAAGFAQRTIIPTMTTLVANEMIASNGPVTVEEDFDAWGKGDIGGEHRSRYINVAADIAGGALNTTTLVITTKVDPAAAVDTTITFDATAITFAGVLALINAAAPTLFTAEIERAAGDPNGVIRLRSKLKGDGTHFTVKATSTSAALLGFQTGVDCPGKTGQALVVWVMWK